MSALQAQVPPGCRLPTEVRAVAVSGRKNASPVRVRIACCE